ncbi:hypothetical protein [Haloechinothrix salitolerans]|uniref:SseB protein N-terminal domain-containing protein n=1 Tax=Haloechinothrix salitolerans TaxID=926830 RepID=A0ABW2C444_9PSEU
MRVLHPEDLLQLAADRGEPRLSLFLPTDRNEPDRSVNQARWGNLVHDAKAAMRADGVPAARVRQILNGPLDLLADAWPWDRPDRGMAMFAGPGSARCYWLPRPVPTLATFGDRFALCPLFPMLSTKTEERARATYRRLSRDGRTVTEPSELFAAADRGRVETLFVSTTVTPRPHKHDDHLIVPLSQYPDPARQADIAVVAVLRHGGRVLSLPPRRMPEQVPMAATLRHSTLLPAPKTTAEGALS